MRNRNRGRKIDERAEALLRDCGQFKAPVDVSIVAAACSARVMSEELDDDVSGFLLREQGSISIAINKQHPANRQRFTLAHEIGHLVGDVPALLLVAAVLWYLSPQKQLRVVRT